MTAWNSTFTPLPLYLHDLMLGWAQRRHYILPHINLPFELSVRFCIHSVIHHPSPPTYMYPYQPTHPSVQPSIHPSNVKETWIFFSVNFFYFPYYLANVLRYFLESFSKEIFMALLAPLQAVLTTNTHLNRPKVCEHRLSLDTYNRVVV